MSKLSVLVVGLCGALVASVGCGGGAASIPVGTMPESGTFSGVFHSPQYGEMHLEQDGSLVHGRYELDERRGKIQGEVDGDVLFFDWVERKAMVSNRPTETKGKGYFKYLIDPSNGDHVLKGRWGLEDDNAGGGEWNAYKLKNREPELGTQSSGGDDGGGSGDDLGVSDDDLF